VTRPAFTSVESVRQLAAYLRDSYSADREGPDETFVAFGIATEYLRSTVDNEWVNQIIFRQHPSVSRGNRPGRSFIKTEASGLDEWRHLQRTVSLAELLFNLRDIEGIDERIADLRAGKVEDTYSELEAGSFIVRRGIPFRFLRRTGTKGADYDGEMLPSGGDAMPCEMKCKVEDTSISESTINNALETARKQLPSGRCALVILKIPESWIRNPKAIVIRPTIADFLRRTSRVVGVVVQWEEMVVLPQNAGTAFLYKHRVEWSGDSTAITAAVRDVLVLLENADAWRTAPWISFQAVAREAVR
jgi:hypothetical protein